MNKKNSSMTMTTPTKISKEPSLESESSDGNSEIIIRTSVESTNKMNSINGEESTNGENITNASLLNSKSCTIELPSLFFNTLNIIEKANKKDNNIQDINLETESLKFGNNSSIFMTPNSTTNIPVISPKNFYSKTTPTIKKTLGIIPFYCAKAVSSRRNSLKKAKGFSYMCINKGVSHKIRRISKASQRKLLAKHFLKGINKDEKENLVAPSLFTSNKNKNKTTQPLTVRSKTNKPQSFNDNLTSDVDTNCMFSDDESDDLLLSEIYLLNIQNENTDKNPADNSNKKFFKSGKTPTRKEIEIVNNIRGLFCNGKISILKSTRHPNNPRKPCKNMFSVEQAAVENIINKLDSISTSPHKAPKKTPQSTSSQTPEEFRKHLPYNTNDDGLSTSPHKEPKRTPQSTSSQTPEDFRKHLPHNTNDDGLSTSPHEELKRTPQSTPSQTPEEFRKRLPYNTNDEEKIEQQHLLLDFLITNDMCTEENFEIFIANPENHRKEAELIVGNLTIIQDNDETSNTYDEYLARIPRGVTETTYFKRQKRILAILVSNEMCTEDNFKYFVMEYEEHRDECDEIYNQFYDGDKTPLKLTELLASNNEIEKIEYFPIFNSNQCHPIVQKSSRTQRTVSRGNGINQLQIDAGQKSYGPKQCTHCGLMYTQHEPEEEKIHDEYHKSLHILRFKGWINEDVVTYCSEWGSFGRIIRIDENSHIKRKERLMDVLKIVDKELGFSSYIIPKQFVAFLAIRQKRIVGLCLVHPLDKANKYICVNGVDCCTTERFETKCGISRIWVSPFDRRFHIASKLVEAVQTSAFVGQTIPISKIAFSTPTEDGKLFAQKISGQENFLVYQ